MLTKSGKKNESVGMCYFQARPEGPTRYIAPISGAKWELWRRSWVIATTDAHERLELPAGEPSSPRSSWRTKPALSPEFDRVLARIEELATAGLTSMSVLCDFVRRRIAPLQARSRPAYLYTGINDFCRLHRGSDSDTSPEEVEAIVKSVSGDVFVPACLGAPPNAPPLCENQELRSRMLAEMPTLDESGLAVRQVGDVTRGIVIGGAPTERQPEQPSLPADAPTSGKGKEVAGGTAGGEEAQRRRPRRGDDTPVGEPAPKRQRTEAPPERDSSRLVSPPAPGQGAPMPPSPQPEPRQGAAVPTERWQSQLWGPPPPRRESTEVMAWPDLRVPERHPEAALPAPPPGPPPQVLPAVGTFVASSSHVPGEVRRSPPPQGPLTSSPPPQVRPAEAEAPAGGLRDPGQTPEAGAVPRRRVASSYVGNWSRRLPR